MKILVEKAQGANLWIAKSFASAFALIGHQVVFWDDTERSVHDIFDEFQPDLFFGHTWRLDRARINCISQRPEMKVVLRANHWGSIDKDIDTNLYPIGIADGAEKKNVELISKHPGFKNVICQYIDKYAKGTHDLWANLGLKPTGIPLCADITDYFLTKPNDKYKTHLCYAGNYWPYKGKNLAKFVLPLCYPNTMLSVRIFGQNWGSPSAVGNCSEETLRNHYASAMAVPSIVEPHASQIINDLPQRYWQIPACGGFQIAMNAIGVYDIFNEDEIVTVNDPKEFLEKFVYFSENPDERLGYVKRGCLKVYKSETNLHRSATLFYILSMPEETEKCYQKANQIYEDINARIDSNFE